MNLVKVNLIATPESAAALVRLGADLISVPLVDDPRFLGIRAVDLRCVTEIIAAAKPAVVVAQVAGDAPPDTLLDMLIATGLREVEIAAHPTPAPALIERLRQSGIAVGYCRLVASHDDDPSWIESTIADLGVAPGERVELELLPDTDNAWAFLRDQPPEFEEELHLEDIDALAARHQLFVSVNATALHELAARLPAVAGFSFNLAPPNPANYIAHGIDLATLSDLLVHRRQAPAR